MNNISFHNIPRSPIRYFGSKSRYLNKILPYIPCTTKKLCSPFLGGGAVELACNYLGIEVIAYDISEPLVNFWNHIFIYNKKWASILEKYFLKLTPDLRIQIYKLRDSYHNFNNYKKAFIYLLFNLHSFAGMTFKGLGIANPNSVRSQINNIRNLKLHTPFIIKKEPYKDSILNNPDCFLYLDPPYLKNKKDSYNRAYISKLSFGTTFNHNDLYKILSERGAWILSYNNEYEIRSLYKDYRIVEINHCGTTGTYKDAEKEKPVELLILSKDIDDLLCKGSLFDY